MAKKKVIEKLENIQIGDSVVFNKTELGENNTNWPEIQKQVVSIRHDLKCDVTVDDLKNGSIKVTFFTVNK